MLRRVKRLIRDTFTPNWYTEGSRFADRWPHSPAPVSPPPADNPLRDFFAARHSGAGIWKWTHYFDAYHRHLDRFRGKAPVVLEIGIYSGGSLDMWQSYFGTGLNLHGVDVEPSCQAYARPGVTVHIGDQADRRFWREQLASGKLPPPDIVIDDGGHTPQQQRVSLEELLPHVRPGGVYICEDIHGASNPFGAFAAGLCASLHSSTGLAHHPDNPERRLVCPTTGWQATIHSITTYPYLVAIEKHPAPAGELVAPKHGTRWEPFLS